MHHPPPTPLQVKEITRSLKEREAKTQAAEAVAAAHLAREKALLEREGALDGREAAVKKVRAGSACRLYRAGSTKRVQPVTCCRVVLSSIAGHFCQLSGWRGPSMRLHSHPCPKLRPAPSDGGGRCRCAGGNRVDLGGAEA